MTSSKPIQSVGPSRAAVRAGITAAYRRVERIFQNGEPMAAAVAVFALACALPVWVVLSFGAAVVDALWRWQ
jgi:hypothetical protein